MTVSDATGDLDAPRAWEVKLRELAEGRPQLVDVCVAIALDALTSLQLIGHENRWWVWLLDQMLVIPLFFRRRKPFEVFIVVSVIAFVQWLTNVPLAADAALLLALYTVASHDSRRRAAIAGIALEVGVVLASVRFAPAGESLLYSLIFLTGLVVAALSVGMTVRTRRAYLNAVVERARQLEVDRVQEAALAVSRERTRIAREMHDVVAHSLSVMIALADGAAALGRRNSQQAAEAMETVSATGRQSLREMRRLLAVLRDDAGPVDWTPQPQLEQLPDLVERIRLTGLTVHLSTVGRRREVPPTFEATAYRIVQESLTNIVKHAVEATVVDVTTEWQPDRLHLRIRDNGRAEPPSPVNGAGHGLAGMAERAYLFGGHLSAGPDDGGGWLVEADLPIMAK